MPAIGSISGSTCPILSETVHMLHFSRLLYVPLTSAANPSYLLSSILIISLKYITHFLSIFKAFASCTDTIGSLGWVGLNIGWAELGLVGLVFWARDTALEGLV